MVERFKRYLEREFRAIAPTREAMEYREEILGTLVDKAQEFRIKGMKDEDMIYDLCIESLGDIKSTLIDFEKKRMELKKAAGIFGKASLIVAAYMLFIIGGFLLISFLTKAWDKSWLIIVGGIFLGIIVATVFSMPKVIKKKKFLFLRIEADLITVLSCVIIFLLLLMLVPTVKYEWTTFLFMIIGVLGINALIAFMTNGKLKLLELIAFIQVLTTLLYVFLGVTHIVAWHPYWLIILFGVFVNICLVVATIATNVKKKKAKTEAKIKGTESEDFYTTWKN